jgi:fructoselysine 6-phosphate deglycase
MEMQWINAPLVNTGEFFHGPFEITDKTLPFVLFVSEGRCRSLDMRTLEFLRRYANRITVIDAKELFINRIDDQVAEFFNHFVFDAAQRRLLANMAQIRGHDMMTRRYMWHVEY